MTLPNELNTHIRVSPPQPEKQGAGSSEHDRFKDVDS